MFGLFKKKKKPDPTAAWPETGQRDLVFDLETSSLNDVGFGTPLEEASRFGRPEAFDARIGGYMQLAHHGKGLFLEYDEELLEYICVMLQPDPFDEATNFDLFVPARATLRDPVFGHLELSSHIKPLDIRDYMGKEQRIDEDEDELILYYARSGHTFEFTRSRQLRRLNIFPAE